MRTNGQRESTAPPAEWDQRQRACVRTAQDTSGSRSQRGESGVWCVGAGKPAPYKENKTGCLLMPQTELGNG